MPSEEFRCIYCAKPVDPTKGEGDHIIPAQLGEFRNDVRFRRICPECNHRIGKSEQLLLQCGPESFLRAVVGPALPRGRRRGRSWTGAMGMPPPQCAINKGDHRELVRLSPQDPRNVYPIDQVIIHDDAGKEFIFPLFEGMKPQQLEAKVKKRISGKAAKTWLSCDESQWVEYSELVLHIFPGSQMLQLSSTEQAVHRVQGRTTLKITDHYFRALAKIGFHYCLAHSRRGLRGDEPGFLPLRKFILGGGEIDTFFQPVGTPIVLPFGELPLGGVVTPHQWCHVLAADESNEFAIAYVNFFLGPGCVRKPHYISLGPTGSSIMAPHFVWAHVYLYDEVQKESGYAGIVDEASVTRIR